jgi:zinc protease
MVKKSSFNEPIVIKGEVSNGMKILLVKTNTQNIVSVGMFVKAGSRYETVENNGIAHFLEHMTFKGTKKRNAQKLNNDLDSVGAQYNASTSYEFTHYDIHGMSKDLNLFLDIIVDIYYNPIFKESDIKTERKVVIEELKMYKDKHDRVLEEIINKKLYAGTSLEMPIIGYEHNIKKFTKKDLMDFRNKFYSHNNSLLVISGDINIKTISKQIERTFSKYSKNFINPTTIQQQFIITPQKRPYLFIKKISKPCSLHQTLVYITFRTFGNNHPLSIVTDLVADIFSNGSSSRLFTLLRNKLGVTYFNNAFNEQYKDFGSFTISLGIDPERVNEVIAAVLDEIKKLKNKIISKKELDKIQSIRETDLSLKLQNPSDYLYYYGFEELFSNSEDPFSIYNYIEEFNDVSPEDVRMVCNEIFKPERLNIFVYGDFNKKKQLVNIIEKFV